VLAGRAGLSGLLDFFGAVGFFNAAAFFDAAPFLRCLGAFSTSGAESSSKSARERFLLVFEPVLLFEPGESGAMVALHMADEVSVEKRDPDLSVGAVLVYQTPDGVDVGEIGEDSGEELMVAAYIVDLVIGAAGCACVLVYGEVA